MVKEKTTEVILWSIALPGFGQFLNGKIIKGIVFIVLEFMINIMANLNTVIVASFQGDIQSAISLTNYQWLMFYPCVYLFGIWDAYKDAGGARKPFEYLPFVISAILGTMGVIYSSTFSVFGVLFGPIFLPLSCFILGILIGYAIKWIVFSRARET